MDELKDIDEWADELASRKPRKKYIVAFGRGSGKRLLTDRVLEDILAGRIELVPLDRNKR